MFYVIGSEVYVMLNGPCPQNKIKNKNSTDLQSHLQLLT